MPVGPGKRRTRIYYIINIEYISINSLPGSESNNQILPFSRKGEPEDRLMFSTNPFAELSTWMSPTIIQAYIATMIALVVLGTLFDVIHKKSARYFRENLQKSRYHRDTGEREKAPVCHIVD